MFRLRFLGSFAITLEGSTADPPKPKLVALLAYLAAAGVKAPRSRDTLLAMFWPERDEATARHALRQSLFELRDGLGAEAVVARGVASVALGTGVWCDVAAFKAAIDQGRDAEALDLYRGELLAGLNLATAPAFERWLSDERALLAAAAARCAARSAESAVASGRLDAAASLLARGTDLTPYDEPLWRRRMEVLLQQGDRAGATAAYAKLTRLLEHDLGVRPAPETVRLMENVRGVTAASEGPPG